MEACGWRARKLGGVEQGRGVRLAEGLGLDIRVGVAEGEKQRLVQTGDQEGPASMTELIGGRAAGGRPP